MAINKLYNNNRIESKSNLHFDKYELLVFCFYCFYYYHYYYYGLLFIVTIQIYQFTINFIKNAKICAPVLYIFFYFFIH